MVSRPRSFSTNQSNLLRILRHNFHLVFAVLFFIRFLSNQLLTRVYLSMIWAILSLRRLSFDESEAHIVYQYGKSSLKSERKAGVAPSYPPIIEDETSFVPSRGWAEMIRKVYH